MKIDEKRKQEESIRAQDSLIDVLTAVGPDPGPELGLALVLTGP